MAVVVAVDGSVGSWTAIRLAAQEARWRDAPLIAVTAYRAAGTPASRPLSRSRPPADDQAAVEAVLRDTVADALGDQSAVDIRIVAGLAGRAIVDAAMAARAQLIVLAARSGISLLPGTDSQYVLRHARCPVLVVPAERPRAGDGN